ncbi:uncharacterized protein RCC_04854 [Ramularia collo-cygni]|uniref:Lysine-specific metallo-endopeptidase domain-containing protein n=1 Tax=Ramularia collo-cygni TaxID=112498 RepID=A0A2D3VBN8_9PEZI|nr:uncharacterized protein RCC_04854 [Ramularia collo-cygni]CZT19009.1 uncharacterized protein RCC_04854 [Ramularia collo-cygni]
MGSPYYPSTINNACRPILSDQSGDQFIEFTSPRFHCSAGLRGRLKAVLVFPHKSLYPSKSMVPICQRCHVFSSYEKLAAPPACKSVYKMELLPQWLSSVFLSFPTFPSFSTMHPSRLFLAGLSVSAQSISKSPSGLDLTFRDCTHKQEKVYSKAIYDTKGCLDKIVKHRKNDDSKHEKKMRTRYFGGSNDEDRDIVTQTFTEMSQNIDSSQYVCGSSTEADDAGEECWTLFIDDEVNTCPLFFKLRNADRANKLILDRAYVLHPDGIAMDDKESKKLAKLHPEEASHNADSYSYYAEAVCKL